MLRAAALAVLLMAPPLAAPCQEVLDAEDMAGIGVQGCETIAGAENAPMLAAAVDWGLGYLAGRRDGGHRPVEGEPLSTTDPADLATGLVLYCREHPHGLVLDALRAYGLRVFAEGPEADPPIHPPLPRIRPSPRPDDAPVLAAVDPIPPGEPATGPSALALPAAAIGGTSPPLAAATALRRAASDAVLAAVVAAGPIASATRREPIGASAFLPAAEGARDLAVIGVGAADPRAPEASPRPRPRP